MSTNEKNVKEDLKQKTRVLDTGNNDTPTPKAPPQLPPRFTGITEPIARPSQALVPPFYSSELLPTEHSQNLPLYKDAPVAKQNRVEAEEFSLVSLRNDERQKLHLAPSLEDKLKKYIPSGYQLSCTPNNNDSWWMSVAYGLNYLINNSIFTVESLRNNASDIVKNKRPDWLTVELLQEDGQAEDYYLAHLSESVAQMKERNRKESSEKTSVDYDAIPGGDIEARLFCNHLPINIHWIVIDEQGNITEKLTNSEGTYEYSKDEENENNTNMVHLVISNNHIVPVINSKKPASVDPNLITAIQEFGGNTKQKLDRSKRLSGQFGQKSPVVQALTEIFETEKIYHENLRHFALAKLPGKKAKTKKTLWESFVSLFSANDVNDADEKIAKTLQNDWPEIKKIANDNGLNEAASYLDDFVSNYTNPDLAEKEIVYSVVTVKKVRKYWGAINNVLQEKIVADKLNNMDEFIKASITDNLPGGWERIREILKDNKLYSAEVTVKFEPFVSGYNLLAKSPHVFSMIDNLEFYNKERLEQEGYTEQNVEEWVNIIYSSIIGDEVGFVTENNLTGETKNHVKQGNTFLNNTFPNMVALKEYYYLMLDQQTYLMENLKEEGVSAKISVVDDEYFRKPQGYSVEAYLNSILISVVQRIGRYEGLILGLQKVLPASHAAQLKLAKILQRCTELNLMANELPKNLPPEEKIKPQKYKFDKSYSGYGLANNYAAISYMVKLSRLINCWQYNSLGREILASRIEQLDEAYKKAEIEFNTACTALETLKVNRRVLEPDRQQAKARFDLAKTNFDNAIANSFAFKSIRAKIWQRKGIEQQYVDGFQNFLQQLFIDSKQYYANPIMDRIDSTIDNIVKKIGSTDSIFANSLLNIKRQSKNRIEAEGCSLPAFPLEIFDDSYTGNNQRLSALPPLTSPKGPAPDAKLTQSAKSANPSTEEEARNAKLAQHFMRLTIINRVKTFFQNFDLQTQHDLFFKSASDSIQRVSYRIQQELDELSKLTTDQYEESFGSKSDREVIGEVIIKIIRPQLEVAGILKDSFLSGLFGQTLNGTTEYLNHINKTNKTVRQMFVQNPLPIRDSNSAAPTFDKRPAHKKIFAFCANLNIITDYYCGTGLGLHIAESAGIKPNTKFRHLAIIQKLALLTERMALDPHSAVCTIEENEAQAQDLLKEMLGKLKKEIIDEFPDQPSRAINELIHLYNYFAQNSRLEELKEWDSRRFENHKLITDYQMPSLIAQNYINKHIAQKYAKAVLNYSLKIDSRVFVETAFCKEETQNEVLKIINDIYEMPVAICKIKIDELPEAPRNISNLIRYRIKDYIQKSLSRKSIYEQGYLGEMLRAVNTIHEQINHNEIMLPAVASTSELSPLLVPESKSAPTTPRKSLTSSMMESNSARPPEIVGVKTLRTPTRTPARTPARKVTRHKTVSVYSSLPLQLDNANSNEYAIKKSSLTLLVSQILMLSHYYRNTEEAAEICKELGIASNNKQGQSDFAKQIANSALEIFLEDESDLELNDRKRAQTAAEREKKLHNKMITMINKIRGSGQGIENLTHSPDSRFAQALVELLPLNTPKVQHRKIQNPLLLTTALINGYIKTANEAKQLIHRIVINQSCKQFEDLEEGLMGKFKKTAGDPQQMAAHKIHLELKKLSVMPLNSCEAEIAALGKGKNIRDIIFHKISGSIVRSGVIAKCIFDGPFGNKLLNVANALLNTNQTNTHGNFLRKIFTPNQVRRYPNSTRTVCAVENTKLAICGRLLMLSDYYLDKSLGRNVADKAAQISGNVAIYNDNNKGWADHAEKIKAIATGLYFGKFKKDDEVIAAIQDALNHLNIIIKDIRRPNLFEQIFLDESSGKHSRFVNELIRIVTDFGKEHGLNISPAKQINERYQISNAKEMFNNKIGSDNFEDYIHMHIIQNSASELTLLKNEINGHRWISFSEKETLRIAEENLDKLFRAGIKERRELIAALPKGQQDLCYLIRDKIKDKIPYSFWTANTQRGRLQQPTQRIDQYLKDITQIQSSPIMSMPRAVKTQ